MKRFARCWIPLLLAAVFCSPLFAEANSVAENEGNSGDAKPDITMHETIAAPRLATDGQGTSSTALVPEKQYGWHISVFPVLAWAPIFGASFTLPPSSGTTKPASGTTDRALNGAYFGGVRFEVGKWSADANFMWAALHAKRETPLANVDLGFVFGDAMGAAKCFRGFMRRAGSVVWP